MEKNKKTFNLKMHKKIDTDEHIDKRLQEDHADAPNEINQKQLEDYRSVEENVTTEKQLDRKRLGSADKVTEKNLNETKGWVKHRNPSAYEGDINKLEEQRLSGEKSSVQEEEPYIDASKTPGFKWWENVKSKDGLKIAQDNKIQKTAQLSDIDELELDLRKPRWGDINKSIGDEGEVGVYKEPMTSPDVGDNIYDFVDDDEFPVSEKVDGTPVSDKVSFTTSGDLDYDDSATGTPAIRGSLEISGGLEETPEAIKQQAADYINDFVIPDGAKKNSFNPNDYIIYPEQVKLKGNRIEFYSGPRVVRERSIAPKIPSNVDLTDYEANDSSEIKVAEFTINDVTEVKTADASKKK